MNFISFSYILFLLIVCIFYYVFPKVSRPFLLLAASYVFYVYNENNAQFALFLLSVTAITYISAILLDIIKPHLKQLRILLLAGTITICFGALVYFKYSLFFFGTAFSLAIPLGISYFTLSSTGYLIDIYRGKYNSEKNFLKYALFVSFFPNIIAGPIERGSNMLPQFSKKIEFDYATVSGGLFRILWGFFKKLVVANALMGLVQPVFASMETYTGPMLLIAALVFAYQLYIDFSALSDIAIGTGALFGLTIMENFKRPLASTSIKELWRRWHISLSSWFRDYLYFPLGGSRHGRLRTILSTLLVFTASGLWHDASMGYLIWGLISGLYLVIGKETLPLRDKINARNPLYYFKPVKNILQTVITYILFAISTVFIAVELYSPIGEELSSAMYLFGNMFNNFGTLFSGDVWPIIESLGLEGLVFYVVAASIVVIEGLESSTMPINVMIRKIPFFLRWPLYYALLLTVYFFGEFGVSGFVYQAY